MNSSYSSKQGQSENELLTTTDDNTNEIYKSELFSDLKLKPVCF